ncbi:putative RecB family nuclease [Pseudonocardia sediminis]|uniref:Putative RecB family nuclease n=1 Tax=Pseudonocardia sediminis TaxID=1397368 RepID=A0A4Q7UQH1_PSEST|nr:TM0106 family RecB-like putative nuclease [Pseudonocardia sediminis]RZT83304.1 putative RecB family nuclease [Pseudonocardia sediminis]
MSTLIGDQAARAAGDGGPSAVLLDAGALTRCRRRVHLDHDPSAEGAPRALPDPALEQRRADAAEHRERIGAVLAAAGGASWRPVDVAGPAGVRATRTAELVAEGAPLIWDAVLPLDRAAGRRGSADLLVRMPGGGYVPLLVVRRRITDPGEGARTTAVTDPYPQRARTDPDRKVRSSPRDLLALAQLTRMLQAAGWAPEAADPPVGGVIGMDADVVVWHDLDAGHWPGGRGTMAEYDARFADRRAVAEAARDGRPALAQPSRITECRRCPWWPTCEAELESVDDVSLVAHGETGRLLRTAGVGTVASLAELDPAGPVPSELPVPLPGPPFADLVALARARRQGRSVVRRSESVPVPRADVEVDVDMESFGESGAYLWGALLTHPGGRRDGDDEPGYRAFATWDPLPTSDEGRSFAEFWAWLTGVRDAARASGRTFAAYCYNEQAENRWMLGSANRFADEPGMPSVAQVQEFIDDPGWIDLFAVVSRWFLCTHGKGLKKIAPAAGFAWRDPEAGGENSMRWYRDAVGMDGGEPDPVQRERLLAYNADDVAATQVLREWMSSERVREVPLVSEL